MTRTAASNITSQPKSLSKSLPKSIAQHLNTIMDTDYIEPATRIDSSDAPSVSRYDGVESLKQFYHRLQLVNTLEWDWEWRDESQQRTKDRQAILDAIASSLELKTHQRERTKKILSDAPDSMRQGYEITLLTFCAAALACKPDGRHYHPDRSARNNDSTFSAVLDRLGLSHRQVRKCYRRLESRIEV